MHLHTDVIETPVMEDQNRRVSLFRSLAYAAPMSASWFFYIPMWSILPGIYAKYFGLKLTSIAGVILFIRLFDGLIDTAIGFMSDWHRSRGGSRKTWVIAGCIGVIVACHQLFIPPEPATTTYYLGWSMAFFVAFTVAEIPHMTWGSELTTDYQQRTTVFGARNLLCRFGILAFYLLPLLPVYASSDYTPRVLRDAVYVGTLLTILGLLFTIAAAPAGGSPQISGHDSARFLIRSIVNNTPLLNYFTCYAFVGLAAGMWFGLVYFYLDNYLHFGARVSLMFLFGYTVAIICTPLWLWVIRKTSKAAAWAVGIGLFVVQLIAMLFASPGVGLWIPFVLVATANVYFCCNDIASPSILGDIVDYGKLKFKQNRGATYFSINTLVFKFGLGIGGGGALGIAGLFGLDPTAATQSSTAIIGLKLGFIVLPTILALIGLVFVLRTPIDRRRHGIIQRRIESRPIRHESAR